MASIAEIIQTTPVAIPKVKKAADNSEGKQRAKPWAL